MSCRQSRLSSAYVTFARTSGLADNQILALNHALMQEGSQHTSTREAWNATIDRAIEDYRSGRVQLTAGSRDPLARLEAAREETPDAGRIYAAERLMARAQLAAQAQTEYLTDLARETGMTMEQAQRAFQTGFDEATNDSSLHASRSFVSAWNVDADRVSLFVDRRSLYAYEQLEQQRAHARSTAATQPAVTRTAVTTSSAIREMGYDPETGRAEIVLASNPDRVYAYRLSQDEWNDFSAAPSLGAHYSRHIRHNPATHYDTAEEASTAAVRRQCPSCGQFASALNHTCPVPGSPEALNHDIDAALAALADTVANEQGPSQLQDALERFRAAEAASVTVIPRGRTTQYDVEGTYIRMPGLSRVQASARNNDTEFNVYAAVNTDENGRGTVTGTVQIHYEGRGQGYSVVETLSEGAVGRSLQCDCEDYRRNYRCEHTEQAIARLNALANNEGQATSARARAATTATRPSLTRDYQASVAATAAATEAFTPVSSSFEEDPEVFQNLYQEYRAKREAYRAGQVNIAGEPAEYPVPFIRENALGGLATRESGRGFGIEIEYGFPNTMPYHEQREARAAIGRELYEAGLTRSEHQGGYGASHGWVRDQHERGWSYEDDGTTGDRDSNAGGEIVSPIMYDEPETWQALETITSIITRNGAVPTRGAGMHVHVSAGDYDHRIENHNRLLAAFSENEDLIYRLSTNPDRGRHRGTGYCRPNPAASAPYTELSAARRSHTGHHLGLNLQSVAGRNSDHVEFRSMDSTLNPAVMQAQIALAVYLGAGATRPGTADLNPSANHTPVGSRLDANPNRENLTGDAWNESTKSFRRFIDRFVPGDGGDDSENPRIRQMVALFASTKWQRRR